jgi:radical SAM superfamily enzyme YgiQ (UPF0313 family)
MANWYQEYVCSLTMSAIVLATINAKWIHPSLALRLLKANLGSLETHCTILEFALRQPLKEKTAPIIAEQPRLVGLSVSIWNHLATLELLKALEAEWKNERQKPFVVLGGPEVSWLPEDAEIFRYADYVIRGEGEDSFRSLCIELLDVTQAAKKTKADRTIFLGKGNAIVNVNNISSPYRLYTDEDMERKLIYVEASRGCPFNCEFCLGSSRNLRQKVREFPLEPFLADMETLIKRGGKTFKFLDRTFNLDIDRAQMIIEFFFNQINGRINDRPFCVHFEMVPSRFPESLKELLCRFPLGTLRLELGIQTFNTQTRALLQMSGNIEEELKTLEFLRAKTNAILHVDLIAGLPGEGLASFKSGFDRLWQILSKQGEDKTPCGFFEIQLGILKCLPGTPIARHNEAYKMKYSAAPPYEVIETGALSAAELDKIKNFARFWELIVNRAPFPALIPALLPVGKPVFDRFMELSDKLLEHFGRNWGIDREELKSFILLYTTNQSNQKPHLDIFSAGC